MLIVGCGYAADFYVSNLNNYECLNIVGCVDRDSNRLEAFSNYHSFDAYSSVSDALENVNVDILLNLTNPEEHYNVSLEAVTNGISVYSEKPFTMGITESRKLVEVSKNNNCIITSAPSLLLNPPIIKVMEILSSGEIGEIRLIKSAIHEGPVHKMNFGSWVSLSGAPWPAKNEFEVGCGFEHGSYVIDLILALMGTPDSMNYSSALIYPDKEVTDSPAPDWIDLTLEYGDSRRAKIELSIVESEDHSFRIIGDEGEIIVEDLWMANSPIILRKNKEDKIDRPPEHFSLRKMLHPHKIDRRYDDTHFIDQATGVLDLATSLNYKLEPLLDIKRSLESINIIETIMTNSKFRPLTKMNETLLDIELFSSRVRRFFL
ncbi:MULTISPECIES: Gfo/Idh/MocA family protein [Photorhabdus]|uniref:Gfo/Idh/MocA family protein n=1 Tax=Photorhabdus TaxID=29487 RepID=UPI000DCC42DF|nr:Gfo/Idh/MocA family oxidoreductase [Photorhabdus kleinii]MCT8343660.1 Gfo/Idh/MocA family oxidoreductase [Photorhabdus kleinii]RAW93936.1 oxidoreductase [Photorhabdus sp. S10-54]RAW95935.1 oxidoreductase [Photorhabdus sp. S9-53]RAW97361.1 oxidoreductase [Photorhabdus sp. S8-52]